MLIPEEQLSVKKSQLPKAGKGLYTKVFIPKGTYIVEYKGTISKWKELENSEWDNGYIYYVTRNHVINARPHPEHLARYANDAAGLVKVPGLRNNCVYRKRGDKIYIYSEKNIQPKEEIFVAYGADYWKTVRENIRIQKQQDKAR
ncbi:MAG: SET domain-containing protein-lysine N-methyltransferase [Chitinophagaceae bacterium]|nr:SET domain-containing protein-lysine N-methyltransferase [Chitinophagaceae bacterium]MCW5925818.1 SET domain-containing protein-lysine N-methyltransferase [Chitinophagaceae bacterium]